MLHHGVEECSGAEGKKNVREEDARCDAIAINQSIKRSEFLIISHSIQHGRQHTYSMYSCNMSLK